MNDIEIRQFTENYTEDVIEPVLHFQNDGTRPLISVNDQPDLLTINESYIKSGGNFWIATERESKKLIGTIGIMPYTEGVAVLKKFFVYEDYQGPPYHIGQRLYRKLLSFVEFIISKQFCLIRLKTRSVLTNSTKRQGLG